MAANTPSSDITVQQRIRAAVLGSVLVSLSVTPLEVAKVRMQLKDDTCSSKTKPLVHDGIMDHKVPADKLQPRARSGRKSFKSRFSGSASAASARRTLFGSGTTTSASSAQSTGASTSATGPTTQRGAPGGPRPTMPLAGPTLRSTLSLIARNEGLGGLYRPLVPTLAMAVPANVLYFVTYETGRDWLDSFGRGSARGGASSPTEDDSPEDEDQRSPNWYSAPLSGIFARSVAVVASAPFEKIRTQLGAQQHGGVRELLSNCATSGSFHPKALFRGLQPTLFRDIPFSSVYWFCYEQLKQRAVAARAASAASVGSSSSSPSNGTRAGEDHAATPPGFGVGFLHSLDPNFVSFACGALSGGIASVISHPFDVVKTRWQTENGGPAGKKMHTEHGSMWRSLRGVFREGKAFAGLTPRLLRVAPACAIMISTYEAAKRM